MDDILDDLGLSHLSEVCRENTVSIFFRKTTCFIANFIEK